MLDIKFQIQYQYPINIEEYKLPTFPDFTFTFSEYWHKEFNIPSEKLSVGFPYIEKGKEDILKNTHLVKSNKKILFISDGYSQEKQKKIAMDLSRLLPDYDIIYKLRKRQYDIWKEVFYPDPEEYPNITIVHNDDVSLYEYFAMSTYQVGVNSTALIEGLYFGLQTFIILDLPALEMTHLTETNYAYPVEGAVDIFNKIKELSGASSTNLPNGDIFFKRNSISNIKESLRYIMENRTEGVENV